MNYALKHPEIGADFRAFLDARWARPGTQVVKGREEAQRLLARGRQLVCDADAVQAAVARMAREITAQLADEFPLVLAVMGGAAVFTGQLLPLLRFPLEFDAIEVTRYDNDIQGREITWRLPPRDNVRGRTVLVVDDILDEGDHARARSAKRLLEMGADRSFTARSSPTRTSASEKPIDGRFRRRHGARPLRVRLRHGRLRPAGATCPRSTR